jgi:hypothetical protein
MVRAFRKVEMVAAACYAASFLLWTLGHEYKFFKPELARGREFDAAVREAPFALTLMEHWEAAALTLLLVAVGLTAAAIRMRRLPGNS